MQHRLNIALKACREASEVIKTFYKKKKQDELKQFKENYTVFFNLILRIINDSYPMGEKDFIGPSSIAKNLIDGMNDKSFSDLDNEGSYIWIINPIDNIDNYLNKIPLYNITIAIFLNNEIECSIIYDPIDDVLISAIKGEGAKIENTRLRNKKEIDEKILYATNDLNYAQTLNDKINGDLRMTGSPSKEFIYLAEGKLDLLVYPNIEVWDSAAGVLVCRESGLIVTDINGGNNIFSKKHLIAGRNSLHTELLEKLK